ncbi:MAG: NAD-dependent epimerase/dehydratase family protein, partial [Saccharolobus sp.]|uniref:NAD-dependent epimerase/dehydratase family protein n=1 Tax=Saccharolobus sp. TaxID=2100761 RepID=UPI0028CFB8B8
MYIVTGGAGYIGSHLVDHLVSRNFKVIVIDDFSFGKYINKKAITIKYDLRLSNLNELINRVEKGGIIYHLAANPDVRTSMINVGEHFERDVKVTLNVMELARKIDAEKVIFTSSSTVYGETDKIPTPESEEPKPISNYGLFKLLCENIIKYYAHQYGIKSIVTRLANITGGRVSHGVVVDFIRKLNQNPNILEILGNGKQKKSYLYIDELIDAFILLENKVNTTYDIYNIGNTDWITVNEIAEIVIEEMKLNPKIV